MLQINAVYPSFDGEVNKFGIGAPTIFLRTQGCHLRCYKKTKGILCDTPEGLERDNTKLVGNSDILDILYKIRNKTGISKVTLTGGDPLWQPESDLIDLFYHLELNEFDTTVETSGTISIAPFTKQNFKKLWWVLDYKLPSTGVPESQVLKTLENLPFLKNGDFVKFVIDDIIDLREMLNVISDNPCGGQYAAGLFWGSKNLTNLQLYNALMEHSVCHKVVMNFQTHKLILNPDYSVQVPKLL